MAATIDASLENVTELIAKGIMTDLSESIEKEIHKSIDSIIKRLAVQYAKEVVGKLNSYKRFDNGTIQLQVFFNNNEITDNRKCHE